MVMSVGNTSHAVRAQRVEPHDSLDDFPTPPWATRALCECVIGPSIGGLERLREMSVWEPACNRGYMARPLREYFGRVQTSDVHDYRAEWGGQDRVVDFLYPNSEPADMRPDWIITNPPFRLAAQFVHRGLELATVGVAVLVRTTFIEGVERYRTLFSAHRPAVLAPFSERVPMFKGRIDPRGSTATSYCWLVWMRDRPEQAETVVLWIPPCRKYLERRSDYAEVVA